MKLHQLRKLQQRRLFVQGRFLVGIDPAKARHQGQLLTPGSGSISPRLCRKSSPTGRATN